MALIKSISGIRGTIGGEAGQNLTPQDIVESAAAFGYWLLQRDVPPKVVIGRDARLSGPMVKPLVIQTLLALGIDVVDADLSTTPTIEMAVNWERAGAGIVLTASHNPREWNALKFLNEKGEFISREDGENLLELLRSGSVRYATVDHLGTCVPIDGLIERHILTILEHPLVDADLVRQRRFSVVVDPVNSTGALSVPPLLEALGCSVTLLNGAMTGDFAHNPEPLPAHLQDLSDTVQQKGADLGIAVDPDVDRLAFVCENGSVFGEEYTLVAVADYVLGHQPGATVSNLSSTRALADVTRRHGGTHYVSAVGEVNVVAKMKEVAAVLGGEGNGGVIVPDLHYGRDALAGIALFLTHLAQAEKTASQLRATYPDYHMVKDRISLTPDIDLERILSALHQKYADHQTNTIDGLKIDFPDRWVHLRKSNTEPIIRLYAEAATRQEAEALVSAIREDVDKMMYIR